MKFGVIIFPGSNCDEDMIYVLSHTLQQNVVKLWHKSQDLQNCDCIVLPGGFSYGDYLRSGAIARFSPIMQEVIQFAQRGGYVFGICNGFQILTEAGLLPGVLLHNQQRKFICKNVYIKAVHNKSVFSQKFHLNQAYKVPIAHSEGNYYAPAHVLEEMQANGQILFQYCNANAEVTQEANPNGSLLNIAGICNKQGNVFGMMPHPERAASNILRNTDGLTFFESILQIAYA
ncbi:MAG: phosphoribosylformylglycinamidine synthase subunit PurQ [Microscillaceae bacterium]|nr:phosphoribosylformylglycinamidine synthase subunit PurQ [Microscillaceae bacterium]MDW8461419.1 phosphoribosylformylglycinamidine synthase subunit PurQ [Cytophagales bacterium]